ncbi:MAG TPA: hypothetical protein VL547_21165 [Dinghuibacter sp.]|uniref:hypothetical protein n=1 Tax=Dinghuibacter sp. TaxID=2024697 RepID=UPI002C4BC78D|nr:hypothetical protein [Dinghuibacter sp.]HTJ14569.1 hypothetical protein [Dinghuibacter sp.]
MAYSCWNTSNGMYFAPGDFVVDSTGKITAQRFCNPPGYSDRYLTIQLRWKGDLITGAVLTGQGGQLPITLTWDKSPRVTGVKIGYLMNFDWNVNYDDTGAIAGFAARQLVNNEKQFVWTVDWTGDRVVKQTAYENKGKKTWIRAVVDRIYTDTSVITDQYVYGTDKSNTPKNIVSRGHGEYMKPAAHSYTVIPAPGQNQTSIFNDKDQKIEYRMVTGNGINRTLYTYKDDKLFREINTTTNLQGDFASREIHVYFTIDAPASAPDWEKTIGLYHFDKTGDLTYEARDGKYRRKVNGVWTDWAFLAY